MLMPSETAQGVVDASKAVLYEICAAAATSKHVSCSDQISVRIYSFYGNCKRYYQGSNPIGVWLAEQDDAIGKPTDAKQSDSKYIEHTHAGLSFVKLVCADKPKEQAKKKSDPFVALGFAVHHIRIYVGVCTRICVADYDAWLHCGLRLLEFFHLAPAMRANYGAHWNCSTTVLAKF